MEHCIKYRQCLYQIKQIRLDNLIKNKDDIGKELLKLNVHNKKIKIIASTSNSKFTKMFEFYDIETTLIEAYHNTMIYLKECGKKLEHLHDTIYIDYQYNFKTFEITEITNIKLEFRNDFNKSFNIDSIQIDNDMIQLRVSNFD